MVDQKKRRRWKTGKACEICERRDMATLGEIVIAIVVRPKYLKSLMIMLSCSVIVHPRAYEQRSCTLILICRTYSVPRSVLARLSHLLLSFFLLCLWCSAGSVSPARALLSMSGFDPVGKRRRHSYPLRGVHTNKEQYIVNTGKRQN